MAPLDAWSPRHPSNDKTTRFLFPKYGSDIP